MIIGGGIAGPVAAMALARVGIDAVIYEAYDRGADGVGAFLTVAQNGLAALSILGLDPLACSLGMNTPRMLIHNARGKLLATFERPSHTVRRADLYTALRDEAVQRGVRIEYGKRLQDAKMIGERVEARFTDGSHAQADVLIGADGLRSRVREIIDPEAPRARHVGLLNTGGFVRGVKVAGEPGTSYFIFGSRCFFGYLIHPDGEVWWFANPPCPKEPTPEALAAITQEEWRTKLLDLFRGDDGPCCELIAATKPIFAGWNTYDFPTVPSWRREHLVIIGDAAHAASPSSGQGASMAIEDAVVLAQCLRDVPNIPQALFAYEGLRRQRVERIVQQGRRNGSGKAPGIVGRVMRDLFMPIALKYIAKRDSQRWIFDHQIDFTSKIAAPAG